MKTCSEKVGRFNVNHMGLSFDKGKAYVQIRIDEFNKKDKPVGLSKIFYFRLGRENGEEYILPNFNTEQEVEAYMRCPNYSRFKCHYKFCVERERKGKGKVR